MVGHGMVATGPATGAKTSAFATERHQFLVVARLTANPQEAVDGCILRPPGIERYSLVKDVVLQATSG